MYRNRLTKNEKKKNWIIREEKKNLTFKYFSSSSSQKTVPRTCPGFNDVQLRLGNLYFVSIFFFIVIEPGGGSSIPGGGGGGAPLPNIGGGYKQFHVKQDEQIKKINIPVQEVVEVGWNL